MTEQPISRFSNREEMDQLREYKRLNMPALLAFIMGIASASALIKPNLWIVPILTVFVGAIGLAQAKRSDDMGGKFSSWAAIVLALFFVSFAASQFYFHRSVLYAEAEVIGKRWLQMVAEGEDEIAHQAMIHPANRQASGFSVDEYYEMDQTAAVAKQKTFEESPAKEILAIGGDAKIELIRNITQDVDLKYGKLIMQTYRVTAADQKPIDATLTIARSYKEDLGKATWIVANIEPPPQ